MSNSIPCRAARCCFTYNMCAREGFYPGKTELLCGVYKPDTIYCSLHSHRYDQGRVDSQQHLNHYEENPSRENEEVSSYLGTLESSKNSGLSSSSYELSQYINGGDHGEPVHQSDRTSDAGERAVGSLPPSLSVTPWRVLWPSVLHSSFRALAGASDVSPSEVLHPSCGGELRASGPAGTGHSRLVHAGERQPAGSPQSGSRRHTCVNKHYSTVFVLTTCAAQLLND